MVQASLLLLTSLEVMHLPKKCAPEQAVSYHYIHDVSVFYMQNAELSTYDDDVR
jgi:hypothetical protein